MIAGCYGRPTPVSALIHAATMLQQVYFCWFGVRLFLVNCSDLLISSFCNRRMTAVYGAL